MSVLVILFYLQKYVQKQHTTDYSICSTFHAHNIHQPHADILQAYGFVSLYGSRENTSPSHNACDQYENSGRFVWIFVPDNMTSIEECRFSFWCGKCCLLFHIILGEMDPKQEAQNLFCSSRTVRSFIYSRKSQIRKFASRTKSDTIFVSTLINRRPYLLPSYPFMLKRISLKISKNL